MNFETEWLYHLSTDSWKGSTATRFFPTARESQRKTEWLYHLSTDSWKGYTATRFFSGTPALWRKTEWLYHLSTDIWKGYTATRFFTPRLIHTLFQRYWKTRLEPMNFEGRQTAAKSQRSGI